MARIRIAKATSGAAFVNKKKATEARLAAVESGQEVDEGPEDIFELQHHHLLRCLEKTTVSYTLLPSITLSIRVLHSILMKKYIRFTSFLNTSRICLQVFSLKSL